MTNWKETTLGEVLGKKGYIRGPFGSSLRRNELLAEGIPVYEQQNAIYDHREFRYFIDSKKHAELSRFTVREDDLIVSCSGTMGKISIIKNNDPVGVISQALLILRPDTTQVLPKYLYYFFHSAEGFNSLVSRSSGSVQVNIAERQIIESIELLLPPLPEQKAIAAVLSSFDDKIELLRRQNKTLEKIAQTIFKEWFVNFTVNGKKLRIDNATGLPEGWRVGEIGDLLELAYGRALKEGDRTGKGYPVVGSSGIVGYHREYLVEGPGIVVGRKGLMGSVIWVEDNFFPIDTTFYVIDKLHTGALFFHLFVLKAFDFQRLGSDSAVPGLNRNVAHSLELPIPEVEVIQEYNDTVAPAFQKMKNNNSQIETLSKLRDLLLPKLMKGEVRVKDAERAAEEVT